MTFIQGILLLPSTFIRFLSRAHKLQLCPRIGSTARFDWQRSTHLLTGMNIKVWKLLQKVQISPSYLTKLQRVGLIGFLLATPC